MIRPYIIELPENISKGGRLSFIEIPDIPFEIKRLYWIYDLEEDASRGGHSNINSDRILVCVQGKASVMLESCQGEKQTFELNSPTKALFFPRAHWITMNCTKGSLIVVAVSCRYEEDEYLSDYKKFLNLGDNEK